MYANFGDPQEGLQTREVLDWFTYLREMGKSDRELIHAMAQNGVPRTMAEEVLAQVGSAPRLQGAQV